MSKEKLIKLVKYADDIKNRLAAPVPAKHVGHPATYKQFLDRELATVSKQIEALKMDGGAKK